MKLVKHALAIFLLLIGYAASTTKFVVCIILAGRFAPFSIASLWLLLSAILLVWVGLILDHRDET